MWIFGPPPPGGPQKNSRLNVRFFWHRLYVWQFGRERETDARTHRQTDTHYVKTSTPSANAGCNELELDFYGRNFFGECLYCNTKYDIDTWPVQVTTWCFSDYMGQDLNYKLWFLVVAHPFITGFTWIPKVLFTYNGLPAHFNLLFSPISPPQ